VRTPEYFDLLAHLLSVPNELSKVNDFISLIFK